VRDCGSEVAATASLKAVVKSAGAFTGCTYLSPENAKFGLEADMHLQSRRDGARCITALNGRMCGHETILPRTREQWCNTLLKGDMHRFQRGWEVSTLCIQCEAAFPFSPNARTAYGTTRISN
jgi:hypothetical protein